MTTTNPGKQTMSVREIADLLGYERLPESSDSTSPDQRSSYQTRLMLDIEDGKLDDPGYVQENYANQYANRKELLEDIVIAKEWSYGFGSTPPIELAEVYGWTSPEHQKAELQAQQRRRILLSEIAAQDLPWEDPEWYRSIARRYNIPANIPDNPDIKIATDEEVGRKSDGDRILPIAYASPESGLTRQGARVRVLPDQVQGMTREEVEHILAHELLHTVLNQNVGHGPEFTRAADERNIPLTGAKRESSRIDGAPPGLSKFERPFAGSVLVHPAGGHGLNLQGNLTVSNNPQNFTKPFYSIHSEPGSDVVWQTNPDSIPLNGGVPGYFLPGSAISRVWSPLDQKPRYWEIGTVQPNGTVKWDCLTYAQPSEESVEDYARDGYCPPELEENEIQPLDYQRRELYYATTTYEQKFTQGGPTDAALWASIRLDSAAKDNTLTTEERKNLIFWTGILDRDALESASKDDPSLAEYTRLFNQERDRIIANRSPETISEIQEGLQGRRQRRLAAPERPQLIGKGAPLRLPITYDTTDIPTDRLDAIRAAANEYAQERQQAVPDAGLPSQAAEYRGVSKEPTYKARRRRGRGKIRY